MRADWVECTFDDVFELITNGSSIKQTDDKNGIPVSRIETIWNETIDWGRVKYAIDYDDNLHNKYLLKNGDILFSHINSDSHLGKTAIFRDVRKLIHGINLLLLRPFSILNSSYILYYLRFTKYRGGFLQIAQRSVNQSSINQRSLKQLIISIPPLPEQRAIVKKIEALFSSLDAGIADLKKAQDQVKIYRQAVLKKAFEGELTKEWREENQYISEWNIYNFKELANVISGKNQKDVESIDGLYPIYGSGGIIGKSKEFICLEGTTIIGRKGTINSPIYVNEKFWNIDTAFGLYPKEKVNNKLFYYWALSFNFKSLDKSTAIPSLAKRDIELIEIFFTLNQEEQAQIVKEIEARLSVCDAVEQQIKDSLSQAEALRQSILKKAFEGKLLTEEEIKACQQEPDYEPAAVLLEKIKAEKEALKPVKKTKKK